MSGRSWTYLTLAGAFLAWLGSVGLLYRFSYAAEEQISQVGPGGTVGHVKLGKPMRLDSETGKFTEMGFIEAEAGPLFLLTLGFAGGAFFVIWQIRRRNDGGTPGEAKTLSIESPENELHGRPPRPREGRKGARTDADQAGHSGAGGGTNR